MLREIISSKRANLTTTNSVRKCEKRETARQSVNLTLPP